MLKHFINPVLLTSLFAGMFAEKAAGNPSFNTSSSIIRSIASQTATPSKWDLNNNYAVPAVVFSFLRSSMTANYTMKLPDGTSIELLPAIPVSDKSLSPKEIESAAEDTRQILQSMSRIILSQKSVTHAVIKNDSYRAITMSVDTSWLQANGFREMDPLKAALEEKPFQTTENAKGPLETAQNLDISVIADPTAQVQAQSQSRGLPAVERVCLLFSFLRDVVYTSTIDAYRRHRAGDLNIKSQVEEFGFQIGLRAELIVGLGKFNVAKSLPLVFSVGYNRKQRTLVFRRGVRKETMSDGSALSIGLKLEFRRYRLMAESAYAADPRPGFASVKGHSWYPPSIPILTPVMDTAPGFQSEGIAFGFNFADAIPGTYLMNTVTSFSEEQRVFSAQVPNPADFMDRLDQRVFRNIGSHLPGYGTGYEPSFGSRYGIGIAARCETMFVSTRFSEIGF